MIDVNKLMIKYRLDYSLLDIPLYISDNLKYELYGWQKEALGRFLVYQEIHAKGSSNTPIHVLFNMATGTGKTLLMAAAMLHYYKHGYRHFLFFVNQNNIVGKTENNFIDRSHAKYLFADSIAIDGQAVTIKKVNTFSANPRGIEVKFTSIQKLYNDIHLQRENQTSLADLHSKDLVLLADEAHHLNTDTRRACVQQELAAMPPAEITGQTGRAEVERKGWEHTVIQLILNKNSRTRNNKNNNVLLEFTATVPNSAAIEEKYRDKILYRFGLKEFLQAGHTKEINLLSSSLNKKQRVLQALLFQWYRHAIALKHNIANFKPVLLFRSKTIEESKADYAQFLTWMEDLRGEDLHFLREVSRRIVQSEDAHEQGASRAKQIIAYINKEKISLGEIALWMQRAYHARSVLITNSKTNKAATERTDAETDKLLNSLEDDNNRIRAIFTVDRLTEGWDVLNLYDIVRLYQGQNAGGSNKKTPEATVKEKQLIGRGVRYYPFSHEDKPRNKRKFDNNLNHPLRLLEELFYHTYDEESRYISHLKAELRKDGFISDDKIVKTFALKPAFQQGAFYANTVLWYNQQLDNPHAKWQTLEELGENFFPPHKIRGLEFAEIPVDFEQDEDAPRAVVPQGAGQTLSVKFGDIDRHIVQAAIAIRAGQGNALFQFETLSTVLNITSMDDLQNRLLKEFKIDVVVNEPVRCFDDIDNRAKLNLALKFLDAVFAELDKKIAPKIGGPFISAKFEKFFGTPKIKTVSKQAVMDSVARDNDWYVLDGFAGTSEELALVDFIKDSVGNLQQKYSEFYLLRNEEVYKIYDFAQGRGFQPDFILFLKTKSGAQAPLHYQIFIEPKGRDHIAYDEWKEKFLQEISSRYGEGKILKAENGDYKLLGLPFFNQNDSQQNQKFHRAFDPLIQQ